MDLSSRVENVNRILAEKLPVDETLGSITDAMTYSVLNGGKRLRAIMLIEAAKLYTEDEFIIKNLVEPFAAALEFIHAYSLVHDDLPAMDNDVLRRGKPTTHVKYGHAMGVLAGDALLNYAYETISNVFMMLNQQLDKLDSSKLLQLFTRVSSANAVIAKKPGFSGMIGGQVLDTDVDYPYSKAAKDKCDEQVEYGLRIYELKTSQLIEIALMCGALLGGADQKEVLQLEKAGYALGLAFQIQDDVLDMISNPETLGKSVNIDEKNDKPTIARLLGLEKAKELVEKYTSDAIGCLKSLNKDTKFLEDLFISLINREK